MIRVDAAGGGIHHLLHPGVVAGTEDHAVQGQVGSAGRLVEIHVAAPAVVGGQMEDDGHAVDGLLGYAW